MFNLPKKLFILLLVLIVLSLFSNETKKTKADVSTSLKKTVEFFIGQDDTVRASGEQFSFYFDNVIIPETPVVKSAIIEIRGISYNNSGNKTVNVDLQQGTAGAGAGVDYHLPGSTRTRSFRIRYDAFQSGSGPISDITAAGAYDYTLYLRNTSVGGNGSFSISSARLILTYRYPSVSADFLQGTKFFVSQRLNNLPSGTVESNDFSVTVSGQDIAIRSAFIRIHGIARGTGVGTIEVSVVNRGQPANYKIYNLDLSSSQSRTGFRILHNASGDIPSSDFPGVGDYTLYVRCTGFDVGLLGARLTLTHQYRNTAGGLPVSGYLISSTVDTEVTGGVAFNSLLWKGDLNGGKIKMQIATSDCQGGQSNYPLCNMGTWGDAGTPFLGSDCTIGTSYEPFANTPLEIKCATEHNNKRYFRYKITLCSNDCVTNGLNNPEVTGVVVNWSE